MKSALILLLFVILTFVSSVELINTRHSIRHALNDLDQLSEQITELEIDSNKLLLEYTHLASGYRIERLAISRLNMLYPDETEIIVIR